MADLKALKATTNNAIEAYHKVLKEGCMRAKCVNPPSARTCADHHRVHMNKHLRPCPIMAKFRTQLRGKRLDWLIHQLLNAVAERWVS